MKKLLLLLLCIPMIGFGQCVKGNCKNGNGTFKSRYGEYVGEFKKKMFHGTGTYTWDNGDQYVGEYKKDNKKLFKNKGELEKKEKENKKKSIEKQVLRAKILQAKNSIFNITTF